MLVFELIKEFVEQVRTIVNRDNITLAIAILGAALSIYNFVKSLVTNRFKIHVELTKYAPCPHSFCNEKQFLFVMSIENRSQISLSVSRILLQKDKKSFDFEFVPHRAYEWQHKSGKQVVDQIRVDSIALPQYISGMGVIGNFFIVLTDPSTEDDLKDWELVIVTNRGKKTVKLPSINDFESR